MGLLDDAIREHLDLKRRRGADPGEVERAEREALGPVRRREAPAATEGEEEEVGGAEAVAYDHAADEDWTYEQDRDAPADDEDQGLEAELPPLELSGDEERPAPRSRRDDPDVAFDDGAFGESAFEEPAFGEPAPAADQPKPAPPPRFARGGEAGEEGEEGETTEYDVEEAIAAPEGDGEEDVLEETPEFLQDTPDHDRLWFEQRPPRDFDFDG